MKKTLFSLAFLLFSISSVLAAGNIYRTTIKLNSDIEITIEVIDVVKSCKNWGYHYGEVVNFKSRSLSNSPYNFTFNTSIFSALGTGYGNYGGSYNLSSVNSELLNVIVFNNGKEVHYQKISLLCDDLTTDNINLTNVQITAWGSANGNGLGVFTNTLPVELLSFDATINQNQVDLTWATASEKNNDFFTIERTVDGIDFEEIGKVAGQGNSSIKNEYAFTDTRPKNGVSYYRLKQTDYNGEFEYFEVKSVSIQKDDFVSSAYPNPAILNRTTVFVPKTSSIVTLNVRNVLGQTILSKEIDATLNEIAEEIELTGSDKMFFVELIQNNTIIARHKILNN